jgi:type II secretory pathway pseudopilin PulG
VNDNRGLTTFEVLVSFIIISVIVSLCLPNLKKTLEGVRTRHAVRNLQYILRSARALAIADRVPYKVKFETHLEAILVERVYPEGEVSSMYPLPCKIDELKIQRFDDTHPPFVFFPKGTSSGGEVIIQTQDSTKYKIAVNQYTGKIKVVKEEL